MVVINDSVNNSKKETSSRHDDDRSVNLGKKENLRGSRNEPDNVKDIMIYGIIIPHVV